MPNVWDADFETDAATARASIESRFPELAPVRLSPFGSGWDNVAWLVNDDIVFRFPRRKIALRLLENEMNALERIGRHVPYSVPFPEFVSKAVEGASNSFAGYRLIPGTTACRANLTDTERAHLAAPLGQFLSALHAVPVDSRLPTDALNRSDIVARRGRVVDNLRITAPLVPDLDISCHILAIERLAVKPLAKPADLRLVHGDLYARHIILDDLRAIAGVIDWGDVHVGDPALDLSIAFSILPASARDDFRRAYGTIDEPMWNRAQFRAIHYGALLTQYGTEIGDNAIRDVGLYALHASVE